MTRHRLFRWIGTALQVTGAIVLALNLPWSGWAFPMMLVGALTWTTIAAREGDAALATNEGAFAVINLVGIWQWLL